MTFENTALAINGSRLNGSLLRRGLFASTNGASGIGQTGDLKVSALAVPGQGIRIGPGVGLVLNDYQGEPNETYVVSNPDIHTVPSAQMPGASGSSRRYLVCAVVGDPDFSQAGHPWMGANDPAPEDKATFDYVRVTLIQVANGATTLNVGYPALVMAALDIPANTTTITNAMITNLSDLAQPRQKQEIFVSGQNTWTNGSPRKMPLADFGDWGPQEFKPSVKVPTWARRAIMVVSINGVVIKDNSVNIKGVVRAQLGQVSGPITGFDYEVDGGNGWERDNLQCAGTYDVSSVAGENVFLRVEANQHAPGSPSANQRPELRQGSQMIFDVRFFEQ